MDYFHSNCCFSNAANDKSQLHAPLRRQTSCARAMALMKSWSAQTPLSAIFLVHLYSIPLRLPAVSPSKKSM